MLYLEFRLSMITQQLLSDLNEAREELDPYALFPDEYTGELRRHALVQSVHFSTRIEGNTLTLEQVGSVLAGGNVRAPQDQVQEVENYRDAMGYVQALALDGSQIISEEVIRTIHYLVSKNLPGRYAPGQYRTEQNFVVDRVSGRRIFLPPSPDDVHLLMREFVDWLNSNQDYSVPVKAALAHLNFAAIHPFFDGNGRTARILDSLILYIGGFKSQDLVSLEAYFGKDNQGYYTNLATSLGSRYSPPKDVTNWIEYYLRAHVEQAKSTIQYANEIFAELDGLLEALKPEGITRDDVLILGMASRNGKITNREYRDMSNLSAQSVSTHFSKLMDKDLLARVGRGRSVTYIPTPRLMDIFHSIRDQFVEEDSL